MTWAGVVGRRAVNTLVKHGNIPIGVKLRRRVFDDLHQFLGSILTRQDSGGWESIPHQTRHCTVVEVE